jgi:hypothetical protein
LLHPEAHRALGPATIHSSDTICSSIHLATVVDVTGPERALRQDPRSRPWRVTIGKTKRLSPEWRAQIVEALEANPNASMVARQVGGVSSRTVQKIAKQAKIEVTSVNGHGTPALAQAGPR